MPESAIFHPKCLVANRPSRRCSSEVLKCIAALSDTVRKNASRDLPGDVYDGLLLGDGLHRAMKREEGSGAVSAFGGILTGGSKGSSPRRGAGRRENSAGNNNTSHNTSSGCCGENVDSNCSPTEYTVDFGDETPTSAYSDISALGPIGVVRS